MSHAVRDQFGEPATYQRPSTEGLSAAARTIQFQLDSALDHRWGILTTWPNPFQERFDALAAEWRDATELVASPTTIILHPAYQRIIGMGERALPLILRDLTKTASPWFWALRAIAGEDPVRPEDRGNVQNMIAAWIRWGMRKGFI